jgi:hypothetical protein
MFILHQERTAPLAVDLGLEALNERGQVLAEPGVLVVLRGKKAA